MQKINPEYMLRYEQELWNKGIRLIAGVDEAGRGPLAGPVVAAAVILPEKYFHKIIKDSKQLSPVQRIKAYDEIRQNAIAVGIGIVNENEIDKINILQATMKAMNHALNNLSVVPEHVIIDGNYKPEIKVHCRSIVKGDSCSLSIAAASIVAKVIRDTIMIEYDPLYPVYGFAKNKGYGTVQHRDAILRYNLCTIHRKTFCRKIFQREINF